MRSRPPYSADHVGSLLRPDALLEQRERWKNHEISLEELREHENEHIKHAVKLQEDAGLQGITDGEYRRESFHVDFIDHIGGIEHNFSFQRALQEGEKRGAGEENTAPLKVTVKERMSLPEGGIEVENFKYLKSLTDRTPKVTIPSPTMTHFRGGREAISKEAYPEMEDFFADLARLYREELALLAEAGCRYVQLDDTNLAYLCDPKMREAAKQRGEDPQELPRTYAALINDSIRDRPDDMAVCIHLCRGNARSLWFAEGGYDPVAEDLFNLTEVDGFFLEYDDARSGGFEPLRFMPKGKQVVLGLVTTKKPDLEGKDLLKRRIEEASKYVPIDQICLSPQCGFSSNAIGNLVTEDDEIAKLQLVVETAEEVWH